MRPDTATYIRLNGGVRRSITIGIAEFVQRPEVQQIVEFHPVLRRRIEPVIFAAAASGIGV